MHEEILINITPSETRVAILQQQKLQDIYIEQVRYRSLVGNIYLGKILRVLPNMQIAFVDIGLPTTGFLPYQPLIREGEELLVQVVKDSVGDKGPKLSLQLTSPKNQSQLKEDYVKQTIKSRLVCEELNLLQRVCRDFVTRNTTKIIIDSAPALLQLQQSAEFFPTILSKLELYTDNKPLFETYAVEREILNALSCHVPLSLGGNLIIQQTEAFTAIDINSGSLAKASGKQQTSIKVNQEAAREIARQIRLRNLSGMIVVDFINMSDKTLWQPLLHTLQQSLNRDVVPSSVKDTNNQNVVIITRKRQRQDLLHSLCAPCEACQGTGFVKSATMICQEIIRKLLSLAASHQIRKLRVQAPPAIIAYLKETEEVTLGDIARLSGKPIALEDSETFVWEQFLVQGD